MTSQIPQVHPNRRTLNDEAHARPSEALSPPCAISFLALFNASRSREQHMAPLAQLCRRYGVPEPPSDTIHFSSDLGPFRVKWERHTEFTRYKFIVANPGGAPFERPAIGAVPQDWLSSLPGQIVAAAEIAHIRMDQGDIEYDALSARYFSGHSLVGALVAEGAGAAVTDLRIRDDGFSRFLLIDHALSPRQAGRMVQRLVEIDAYRILALFALPVAREVLPRLLEAEAELAAISAAMSIEQGPEEPQLLDRLTRLEAQIQHRHFETASRFSAADAYYRLVQARIDELRESRILGLQTFREFIDRRLAPAMSTCASVSSRQEKLSLRVGQTTQLLSTRVEVATQRQTQTLLESMNRRARLQLRLQQTVEGLSVAAITYYVVGLIAVIARGLASGGVAVKPEVVTAVSVPLVATVVALGVRRVRRAFAPEDHAD
jgi:uncharacterized membrane-anchored protein